MPTKLDPFFNWERSTGRGGGLKHAGQGQGRGQGQAHGQSQGRAAPGTRHDPTDVGGRGRSEWSPGHQKREAGDQSARDYAPGHTDKPEWTDRQGRETVLPDVAPEEMAED